MDHVHPHERGAVNAGARPLPRSQQPHSTQPPHRLRRLRLAATRTAPPPTPPPCFAQISISAVHRVLNAVLSPPHFDKFIQSVAEVMELSYPYWWPGQGVGLATDNFQMDQSYQRQALTRKNTARSNPLLQARSNPTPNPNPSP